MTTCKTPENVSGVPFYMKMNEYDGFYAGIKNIFPKIKTGGGGNEMNIQRFFQKSVGNMFYKHRENRGMLCCFFQNVNN